MARSCLAGGGVRAPRDEPATGRCSAGPATTGPPAHLPPARALPYQPFLAWTPSGGLLAGLDGHVYAVPSRSSAPVADVAGVRFALLDVAAAVHAPSTGALTCAAQALRGVETGAWVRLPRGTTDATSIHVELRRGNSRVRQSVGRWDSSPHGDWTLIPAPVPADAALVPPRWPPLLVPTAARLEPGAYTIRAGGAAPTILTVGRRCGA